MPARAENTIDGGGTWTTGPPNPSLAVKLIALVGWFNRIAHHEFDGHAIE
jgi:hypothetical protein